ncbi:sensor histidine kinase [Micromonospora sp. NBC_00421]|uniref:sensor histidine kinase n=1 Tax=Micromonospora sp. NBC_00421 TaxID=2975976 RepID=UPI002E2038BA
MYEGERTRRWAADLLLWAVFAAPVAYPRLTPPYGRWAVPLLVGALALLAAAVLVGRRSPVAAVLLVLAGSLVDGNFVFALVAFSYLAGRRSARTAPAAVLFTAVAVGGTVLHLALLGTGMATWFLLSCVLLGAGVFPWLAGRYRRQQQALVLAAGEHAEAVRREQRGVAERIRLRERARIAEEMHDSLGHDLSLIALRAAALELAAGLPDRHRAAAGELRASVGAATERLHGIIGMLRDGPAGTSPVGESIADLVAVAHEAGLAVRLAPGPAGGRLPTLVANAAHRVVREALTNAARYAPGASVTVAVAERAGWAEVRVVNEPPPAGAPADPPSHGSGLAALCERLRLLGGTLDAGPTEVGGFAVTARLPLVPPVVSGTGMVPGRPGPVLADPVPPWPVVIPHDRATAVGGSTDIGGAVRAARRSVRRSLLVALGTPPAVALALSLVYYPVATAGAVLDRPAFDGMRLGTARAELSGLPRRQVEPPVDRVTPPGGRCEYYTDGNFPLAQPSWRLCFVDGRLTSKDPMPR